MGWRGNVHRAFTRATGYELRPAGPASAPASAPKAKPRKRAHAADLGPAPAPRPGDRLVESPVFILCTLRSGSTLLRMLLDSHSQICAPHEIHLRYISVRFTAKWADRTMRELGFGPRALEHLLWDRILHRELATSGKALLVEKTPNNVFIADRLKECWPEARFIHLLRHPAAIARSRQSLKGDEHDAGSNLDLIRRYCEALEQARQRHPGHTVRYEELTSDPAAVTQGICSFLGVPWEEGMLDYGEQDHGALKAGLGDWREKIRTGRVQTPEPPPADVPEPLRAIAAAWGYLPAPAPAGR